MALRQIVKIGDDTLRTICKEVTVFDQKLSLLLDDMFDTMIDAQGVGLAAPQVGILRRIAVVCTDGKTRYELINPKIVKSSGSQTGLEGCLSIPNRHGMVERPKKLTVETFDRQGNKELIKVEGFTAVAFCHEMDHLDGVMFVDKMQAEVKE